MAMIFVIHYLIYKKKIKLLLNIIKTSHQIIIE